MAKMQFRTNTRLWLGASATLFVALGFVDHLAGVAKGDNSLWGYFTLSMTGAGSADLFMVILLRSVLQAGLAAALGWVVQAAIVASWSMCRSRRKGVRFRFRPFSCLAEQIRDKNSSRNET